VRFHWTIAKGAMSCRDAGLDTIEITTNTSTIDFSCDTAAGQVGTIADVPAGPFAYSVHPYGLDDATTSQTIWAGPSGQVTVTAGATVDVNLDIEPDASQSYGGLAFQWTFGGGGKCASAGVTDVAIRAGGLSMQVPCTANGSTATVGGLPAGQAGYTLLGLASGTVVARADGQALVTANQITPFPVDLALAGAGHGGRVAFTWALGCALPQVEAMALTLGDGAPTIVPCYDFTQPGIMGATIDGVPAGTMSFTVSSVPSWWQGTGSVTVTAGATATAHAPLYGATNVDGSANYIWSFGGKTCAQSGVTQVEVSTTDGFDKSFTCSDLHGDEALNVFGTVPGGAYPWTLTATGASGAQFHAAATLTTSVQDAKIHVDLLPGASAGTGTGDAILTFRFGAGALDCADAGVDHVTAFVTDIGDKVVVAEQVVPCGQAMTLPGLPGGAYFVNAEGLTAGNATYRAVTYAIVIGAGGKASYVVNLPQAP
jgi:hypothetical protein